MTASIEAAEAAYEDIDRERSCQLGLKQPPLVDSYPLLEAVPATPTLLTKMGWPANWGIKWVLIEGVHDA